MEQSPAELFADQQLTAFKQRMRISTDDKAENDNLTRMLSASFTAITQLVGVKSADDVTVKELIFNRARYEYNDALDEFLENFKENIRYAYLANLPDPKPPEFKEVQND